MAVSVNFAANLETVVSPGGVFVAPGNATITVNGLDENGTTYTASTTPPVTKMAAYEVTLSSGSATINLAALTGLTSEETVNGTGLKAQFIKLKNKSTNANAITVTKGASNGYGLDAGGSSFTVVLSPGQSATFSLNDAAPDIASGARTWDVTGTGSQVLQIHVVMG